MPADAFVALEDVSPPVVRRKKVQMRFIAAPTIGDDVKTNSRGCLSFFPRDLELTLDLTTLDLRDSTGVRPVALYSHAFSYDIGSINLVAGLKIFKEVTASSRTFPRAYSGARSSRSEGSSRFFLGTRARRFFQRDVILFEVPRGKKIDSRRAVIVAIIRTKKRAS